LLKSRKLGTSTFMEDFYYYEGKHHGSSVYRTDNITE
jgi:hypothetical protein